MSMRSNILPPSRPCSTIASGVCAVSWSSSSHAEPISPPRLIEPMATLPSSAPSSARSSRMSGVAITPSTPGSASAVMVRSSTSRRSAMTKGWPETPTIPRAGWSMAMMNVLPSAANSGRDDRVASARPIASGSVARVSNSPSQRWSSMIVIARSDAAGNASPARSSSTGVRLDGRHGRSSRLDSFGYFTGGEQVIDLGGRRHLVGAHQTSGDDRSSSVRTSDDLGGIPPCEQAVTE